MYTYLDDFQMLLGRIRATLRRGNRQATRAMAGASDVLETGT